MPSDAQRRAVKKYDAENTKFFGIKLNLNTDADLIEKLESVPAVQTYIKELITADLDGRVKWPKEAPVFEAANR